MKINKFKHLISDPPKWTKYFFDLDKGNIFFTVSLNF